MRIGINLLYLRPAKVGGSEVYIRELIRHLNKIAGVKVILICSEEVAQTFSSINRAEARIVSTNKFSLLSRFIKENFTLRRHLNDIDILFSPANFVPPFLFVKIPQVVTVHDLQHLWLKENFSFLKRSVRSFLFRSSFIKCKQIIAISEFTRLDLIRNFKIAPERITTVYHGIDKKINFEALNTDHIIRKNKIEKDYFLFPAALFPHKNHFFLIDAFAMFKRKTNSEAQLIFTGDQPNRKHLLCEYIEVSGLENCVRHLGFLKHDEVLALMANAKALLFPSKFEGFGLPLIEAMLCGTPVIASNLTSIPEIVDNAALLVDPNDLDGWVKAMEDILINDDLRKKLIAKGYKNIERFSWERCAEQTIDVFIKALNT